MDIEVQPEEPPPVSKKRELKQEPLSLTPEKVIEILNGEPTCESPVDLSLLYEQLVHIRIPPLQWNNFTLTPEQLKLTNTSYSVVLTGQWQYGEMPFISGGPLLDDYVFSQIHFHWGGIVQEDSPSKKCNKIWILSGSEHSVDHDQYPFEMHVVFHKRSCESHEAAKSVADGIVILVYLCADVTEEPNPYLEPITRNIRKFFEAFTIMPVELVPLCTIVPMFTDDYLLYASYMKYKCNHRILWLISRESFPISLYQLCKFQSVRNKHSQPITNPFRQVQPLEERSMFLVNPSRTLESLIHFREDLTTVQEFFDEGSADVKSKEEGENAAGAKVIEKVPVIKKKKKMKKKKGKKKLSSLEEDSSADLE
uniref:Carbonic anhydrase n=1 Tax=Rhodnius prolixus TaxID=13249 RepID=T1HFH7_RHOPR